MKIIWINGTFGSGKTTVATTLVHKIRNAYLLEFDALQKKYKPNSIFDFFGERYPESKKYLVDALIFEIENLIKKSDYDYLVIPIALINDYCNEKLVSNFKEFESYHFILTASQEVLHKRIIEQKNRDIDLALTYMPNAMMYLKNHYPEAVRLDTSFMNIDETVDEMVRLINR